MAYKRNRNVSTLEEAIEGLKSEYEMKYIGAPTLEEVEEILQELKLPVWLFQSLEGGYWRLTVVGTLGGKCFQSLEGGWLIEYQKK